MLSSQCWANLYLDHLDHELVDHQGSAVPDVTGYVRYMDDFALFAETKPTLHAAHDYVRDALGLLGLELKTDATLLAPARQGLPFLGFLVHRGTLRVRPANKRRIRVRLRARMKAAQRGEISEEQLARSAAASCEHLRHANTKGMRRHWFGQHDVNG
jgi:RNA-directed DNA polymerase